MSNDAQPAEQNPAPAAEPAAAPAAAPVEPAAPATLLTGGEPAPAAEAKPGEAPAAEPKAEEKPQGAPEAYADFTAPEGVKFNDEAMTEFKAFAKEKNLSQEDAQKLVDFGSKHTERITADLREQIVQAQAKWATDAKADKEFGGDKFGENAALAKRALDTFGTPELTKLLDETGLGNHPEVIRAFFRMAQAVSEDKLVPGGTKPKAGGPQTFYDKSGMNP